MPNDDHTESSDLLRPDCKARLSALRSQSVADSLLETTLSKVRVGRPSTGLNSESLTLRMQNFAFPLRDEILSGKIALGVKIIEKRWARRLAEMREAIQENDLQKVVECVQWFHLRLIKQSGNAFLEETTQKLIIPLYAFTIVRALFTDMDPSMWEPQLRNHWENVDALHTETANLAVQALSHSVSLLLESILEV